MKKEEREARNALSEELRSLYQKLGGIEKIPQSVINGDAIRAMEFKDAVVEARQESVLNATRKYFKGDIPALTERKERLSKLLNLVQ